MIVDAIVGVLEPVWTFLMGLLPTGRLSLPSASGLSTVLGKVDSLVPIAGPLAIGLTILSALAVFLVVRLVFLARNFFLP